MDFIQKHTFITAFIVIGIFLIIKFLILPYLDVKGIKKEINKTKTELQKSMRSQLSGATDMSMFREKSKRRK